MGFQSALNSRFGKLAFLLIDKWEPIVILLALDSKCFKNKERNCSLMTENTVLSPSKKHLPNGGKPVDKMTITVQSRRG